MDSVSLPPRNRIGVCARREVEGSGPGIGLTSRTGSASGGRCRAHAGSWSPDGRQFTFVRSESLYVAGFDGKSLRLIAQGGELHSLAWSPDGRWIAYAKGNRQSLEAGFYFGNAGKSAIYLVAATGGQPIRSRTMDRPARVAAWLRGVGPCCLSPTVKAAGYLPGPPEPKRSAWQR